MVKEVLISQLAHGTALFLKDASQVPVAIFLIQTFSDASGLTLNIEKWELLALKEFDSQTIVNVLVKDSFTLELLL